MIRKAFQSQIEGNGSSLVEILSICPTNWKMTPQESHERIRREVYPVFPLGVYKEKISE